MAVFGERRYTIEGSIAIEAPAEVVWRHVTEVDIASFDHPPYFSLLGIPKPLRAEMDVAGLNGKRTAFFSNGKRFSQTITEWRPFERYAFTFEPDPGFRVGYMLDLHSGPFRMTAGSYRIVSGEDGVRLFLRSEYVLRGLVGVCLYGPVRVVLGLFQRYLLRGIKVNAEGELARSGDRPEQGE